MKDDIRYSLSPLDEKPYDNGMAYIEPQTKPKVAPPVKHQPKKDRKLEELSHLQRLYLEKDAEFEKAKGKRTIITILGFAVFYYGLLYTIDDPSGIEMLYLVLPAVMMAAFHVFVNATIFGTLASKGREEAEILDSIKKRIIKINKEKGIPDYNDWRDD